MCAGTEYVPPSVLLSQHLRTTGTKAYMVVKIWKLGRNNEAFQCYLTLSRPNKNVMATYKKFITNKRKGFFLHMCFLKILKLFMVIKE